jgi:mRNA interferase MazF
MRQREIWLTDLNPVKGNEQQGIRPVVVVSGNAMNEHLGICIICPLTTKIKKYAGCVVLEANSVNGLRVDSEVITFQVRAISGERLVSKLGEITVEQMDTIRIGLNEILTY